METYDVIPQDDLDVCGSVFSTCTGCVSSPSLGCGWCVGESLCLDPEVIGCGTEIVRHPQRCAQLEAYSAWGLWWWTMACLTVSVVFALLLYCLCTIICFPPKPPKPVPQRKQAPPQKPPAVVPVYVYEPAQPRFAANSYQPDFYFGKSIQPPAVNATANYPQCPKAPPTAPAPAAVPPAPVAAPPAPAAAPTAAPPTAAVPAAAAPPPEEPSPESKRAHQLELELEQLKQQREEDRRSCIDLQSRNEELRDRVTWLNKVVEKKTVAETATRVVTHE